MSAQKPLIYLVSHGPPAVQRPRGGIPPFGILYVGQALLAAGYRVRVFHLWGPEEDRVLEEAVREEKPLFVGFSNFLSPLLKHDVRLSKWVHAQGVKVVWGGIFSTAMPEVSLAVDYIDYIVVDEGEKPVVPLADALAAGVEPAGIPGVGYRKDGSIVLAPPLPPETDLDRYRFGYELLDWNRYIPTYNQGPYRQLHIPFARGCPFNCSFCYNSMNPNRQRWRVHGADFMQEMTAYLKRGYGANAVALVCDNTFGKVNEAKRVIEAMKIPWSAAAHLSLITPDFLDWAQQNLCLNLGFGIESASDATLQRMKKGFTREQIREKILLCAERGQATELNWISFTPDETLEDRRLTVSMIDELWEKDPITLHHHLVFQALPQTPFGEEAFRRGHPRPRDLEGWANYSVDASRALGFSERHVTRFNRLVSIYYSETKATSTRVPAFLRPWLRKRILHATCPGPVEEILHAGRIAKDKLQSLLPKKPTAT